MSEKSREHDETGGERALVLPAEDGGMYVIPQAALETFRLSDEQQAKVEAHLPAGDDDVSGFGQYIGRFNPTKPGYWYRTSGPGSFGMDWDMDLWSPDPSGVSGLH